MANPPQHRGQGLSLKRQLLLWLLLPQLVLFLVGGALAYRIALSYAEKAIDQSLTQSVRSLARQVKPIGSGLLIDFPRAAQDIIEQDPKDRVSYMVSSPPGSFLLGNGKLPGPAQELQLPTHEALLYNAQVDGKPMRVALIEVDYGDSVSPQRMRVQVAKSLAVQQRLTTELIADMLGVRREGVTEAAGKLQDAGLISYSRGCLTILDRPGLEARVCECYEVVKKEFVRLLPDLIAQ